MLFCADNEIGNDNGVNVVMSLPTACILVGGGCGDIGGGCGDIGSRCRLVGSRCRLVGSRCRLVSGGCVLVGRGGWVSRLKCIGYRVRKCDVAGAECA